MRAYFFNNMYLNGIHNGIQGGHALDQMWLKYVDMFFDNPKNPQVEMLHYVRKFSKKHKTFIMLMAGEHQDMMETFRKLFKRADNPYPFERFLEPGLNNTLTSICIIIPKCLYDDVSTAVGRAVLKSRGAGPGHGNWELCLDKKMLRVAQKRNYTAWEFEFLAYRVSCPGLAK